MLVLRCQPLVAAPVGLGSLTSWPACGVEAAAKRPHHSRGKGATWERRSETRLIRQGNAGSIGDEDCGSGRRDAATDRRQGTPRSVHGAGVAINGTLRVLAINLRETAARMSPMRPKWMRQRTYDRVVQQIEVGEDHLNVVFTLGAQRILTRIDKSERRRGMRR
jgi:hypothetical protein